MILPGVLILLLTITCESPGFSEYDNVNLIARIDPLTDMTTDDGILLTASTEPPPEPGLSTYYLNLENLVAYSTFEETTGTNNWTGSAAPPPSLFAVETGTDMSGDNYLHLDLRRDNGPEYVYHTFNGIAGNNYVFRFDYKHITGGNLQISQGTTADDFMIELPSTIDLIDTVLIDFSIFATNAAHRIRFGYTQTIPEATNFNVYIDNICLFINNDHRMSISLPIDSDAYDPESGDNDTIYEGIYRLQFYAKAHTSDRITLLLGQRYKTFILNTSWQQLTLEAQILAVHKTLDIALIPTDIENDKKFAGGIYISSPKLYFLPDKTSPAN